MQLLNTLVRSFFLSQHKRLTTLLEKQCETQEKLFKQLIRHCDKTLIGKSYGTTSNMSVEQFRQAMPIHDYPSLMPYVERIIRGESNILWDKPIKWMAKSSGTTSAKSKYIPVSSDALYKNNYAAASDELIVYSHLFPDTQMFGGKSVALGGSFHTMEQNSNVRCGDVSAILLANMPSLGDILKAPRREILLMQDWNQKLELMVSETYRENVTTISGVPSWMLLVLKRVMEIAGKSNILEVWPNLEVYFHGGVAFAPYREEFKQIIPKDNFTYLNTYNASEGFFGFQDTTESDDMLLLCDHGVFYEFIPMDDIGNAADSQSVLLQDVKLGQTYALVITTMAGLWRYKIGDTIEFTSLNPYRFKITGRTSHYINVFGEELIVDNADKALEEACRATHAILTDYTAAPVYLDAHDHACHEWAIEFSQQPDNLELFTDILDQSLKQLNSDYEAKRTDDLLLTRPLVHVLPQGTFLKWLASRNKLGGQHKVPRLQNDRSIITEILAII